ncbi:methylated-DNA--[protein]-cysteine S-methyltransferase [Shewanella algae]|uniref:methylated-DNA--[protein]-cysteine S-methyltransferase n=1 Tax=Shewanella algae TaxID=38313 RepID=UPI00214A974C|nr:methylated-DNA--[protein]-cysteine S-methyltransferase [Shewanella algae]
MNTQDKPSLAVSLSKEWPAAELVPVAELIMDSAVGRLWLAAGPHGLSHLSVLTGDDRERRIPLASANAAQKARAEAILAQTKSQLLEYFAGARQVFELPLAPKGTRFQRAVWQALVGLSYGSFTSYGELAVKIDNPKAVRAVGTANGANPIAIIVPCHRVIGKDGRLTGYVWGLAMKQQLLDLEAGRPS